MQNTGSIIQIMRFAFNIWNIHPDNNARVLWAEEGLTGSDISYTSTADGATSQFSTRRVRDVKVN